MQWPNNPSAHQFLSELKAFCQHFLMMLGRMILRHILQFNNMFKPKAEITVNVPVVYMVQYVVVLMGANP